MVRAGCVFVVGIHPSRTWTSGSFKSVRWNACMHRLDLGLYSHPKEFLGEWSLNPCQLQRKNSLYRKCPQRRIEPATLWTASPSTTNWAIPAPSCEMKWIWGTPDNLPLLYPIAAGKQSLGTSPPADQQMCEPVLWCSFCQASVPTEPNH